MIINEKEYKFMLTAGAAVELAKICPDEDIRKYGDLLTDNVIENIGVVNKLAVILSKGYADAERCFGRNADQISEEMMMSLPFYRYIDLQNELQQTIRRDIVGTVETKPVKGSKKAETEAEA